MKLKTSRTLKLLNIILPFAVIFGTVALFLNNYLYNSKERVYDFSVAERVGTDFVFENITVKLAPRSGDAGIYYKIFPSKNQSAKFVFRKNLAKSYKTTKKYCEFQQVCQT